MNTYVNMLPPPCAYMSSIFAGRYLQKTDFLGQEANFPTFQSSNFPFLLGLTFRLSIFPIFQFFWAKIFQLSIFPIFLGLTFHFSNFSIFLGLTFHFSNFPIFLCLTFHFSKFGPEKLEKWKVRPRKIKR